VVVPYADFINHHNVDSSYEIVNSNWPPVQPNELEEQEELLGHKDYHTQSKADVNYALLYGGELS